MLNEIKKDTETRMTKSLEMLKQDLGKLRVGRAHPSILDGVIVDYYGAPTPLNQVASITVSDPRTLGLNPSNTGNIIRIPLPPLTEERRLTLIKQMKTSAEEARVSIRNVRRDANNHIKTLLKDKEITEDEERRAQENIQKITDKFISDVDKMAEDKEADLIHV